MQLDGSAAVTAGAGPCTLLAVSYSRTACGCAMSGGNLIFNRASGTQTRVEFTGGVNLSVTAESGLAETATVPCGG